MVEYQRNDTALSISIMLFSDHLKQKPNNISFNLAGWNIALSRYEGGFDSFDQSVK